MIEPRQSVKNLHRIKDFGSDRSGYIRLDKNERTIPFRDEIYNAIMAGINPELITMYPDQNPLYEKLASFLGVNRENLLLTAGSDAALKIIFETYINPGDEVVFLDPTYAMIEVYSNLYEARKVKIGYASDLKLDFNKLIESITGSTRAVIVANPNQPTGTILSAEQIKLLLKKTYETNALLVFDEAYLPFSGAESLVQEVQRYSNLVIVQTFSKALGLAAIRLGYVISHQSNIDSLYKLKTLSDVNLFALKFGEYVLENYRIVTEYVESVRKAKEWIKTELKFLDIEVIDSYSNFIHLKFKEEHDLEKIDEKLKRRKYLVRISGNGLPAVIEGCIRITVGTKEQMQGFISALKEILSLSRVA